MTGSASRRIDAGFTLIELMIVVVIVAVMLTLVAPSFYTTIKNNRLRTEADRIVTSFNLARSESVKRNIDVVICARSGNPTPSCATTGIAAQGWLIFADLNQNAALDTTGSSPDILLKVYEALPQGYSITKTDGTAYDGGKIAFYPDGSSNSPETIYLCSQDKDASAAWAISVNPVGGVTASRGVGPGGTYQCAP
jgi:type IV fimbrial biogenesis protein FimT